MKKAPLFIVIISAISLSSCSLFKIYSSTPKEVNVYDLDEIVNKTDAVTIDRGSLGTVTPRFIDGEQYIPYFTLEQYAALYKPHFDSTAKSEVTDDGSASIWTISVNDELCFYAAVSPLAKQFVVAGSISTAFKSDDDPVDYGTLSYGVNYEDSYIKTRDNTSASYYFKNCSFKMFKKDGAYYYPLGLLDTAFSDNSGIYFFYNYKNIYETREPDNFEQPFYLSNKTKTTVNAEMEAITAGKSIPSYLIEYNANTFIFLMENFYGLKSTYGISSIKDYYNNNGLYKGLLLYNDKERGKAYSRALACFDDHHTVLVSINNAWGEGDTPRYGGPNVMKRQKLGEELFKLRRNAYSEYYHSNMDMERAEWADALFSENKRTAMFFFNNFEFGTMDQVFDANHKVKADAGQYDTYYAVKNHLDGILASAGDKVKNVIIDVSTNGGGVIGVMTKILSLLSKDNNSELALYDEGSGAISVSKCHVDVNDDGEYTKDETYGNKFNIYLLTSDYSFSCGNAFPCYAQKIGIKTIGEKSGGGECAVSIHYLPNSQYVYHSSTLHIGYNDIKGESGQFVGFEGGAKPDISLVPANKKSLIEYDENDEYVNNIPSNFYDIDYLDSLISG